LKRLGALVISSLLALGGAEWWLRASSAPALEIPEEWRRRPIEVAGATHAFLWHGHPHVFGADGFRRVEPFPPRRPEVARVAVFGDSLTYGYAVAAESAYPATLEALLSRRLAVEVLNLGIPDHEGAQILETMRRWVPALEPDLVVYGMCVNDFLPPSDGPRYRVTGAERALRRSALVSVALDNYRSVFARLGLIYDFEVEILRDFAPRRVALRSYVRDMNQIALEQTGAPAVAMVVDPVPAEDSRRERLVAEAESALRDGGMTLVPVAGYRDRVAGRRLGVSRWDGHPNDEAHRIFAEALEPAVAAALAGGRPN
jgi:lysophospholipase L1-like esterase